VISKHTCLDGQELDCPVCRSLLLEAFRAPPEVSEEDLIHATGIGQASRPVTGLQDMHLGPPGHILATSLTMDPAGPGGSWSVACSCDWVKSGHFHSSAPAAVNYIQHLIDRWVRTHRENPQEGAVPLGHTVSTALDTGLPEGVWTACCSCGWMRTGTFPSASSEAVRNARHLMQMHAQTHTDNPLKGTEDQ
jgi:hypothetical protein